MTDRVKNMTALAIAIVFLFILAAMSRVASAANEKWRPNRPIRLVVAGSPGGAFSIVSRLLAPTVKEVLGQPLVLDNRGGRGGTIAGDIVVRAKPDGHTILITNGLLLTVRPQLHKMPYKVSDLAPISTLVRGQYMLALHPSVKANNLKEFIALAKSKPAGHFNYAATGVGAPTHLAPELLSMRAGIKMTNIPYKGGAKAAKAALSGEVHMVFVSLVSAVPFVKAGRLKGLAVSGPARATIAPNIPTVAELGYPGFDVSAWFGMFAPAKTPRGVLESLADAFARGLEKPDVKKALIKLGYAIYFKRTNDVVTLMRNETKMWGKAIKAANIKSKK